MKDYWVTFKAEGYITVNVRANNAANAQLTAYHIATDTDCGELEHIDFSLCCIGEEIGLDEFEYINSDKEYKGVKNAQY